MKKALIIIIIIIILIGVGLFYGGMKYGQSKNRDNFGEFRSLSPEERQQRIEEMGTGMNFGEIRNRADSGFVNGKIISKDDQSITIEIGYGGSKIIFYSDDTEISKFVNGELSDLEIEKSVIINGTANEDGSITAQSIQLRPEMKPLQ